MVGYPYFYETDNLNQGENFMMFSLDPISEDSELNLAHASSLPILPMIIEKPQFKLGDEFSYRFCDQISSLYHFVEAFKLYPKHKLWCLTMMAFVTWSLNQM